MSFTVRLTEKLPSCTGSSFLAGLSWGRLAERTTAARPASVSELNAFMFDVPSIQRDPRRVRATLESGMRRMPTYAAADGKWSRRNRGASTHGACGIRASTSASSASTRLFPRLVALLRDLLHAHE